MPCHYRFKRVSELDRDLPGPAKVRQTHLQEGTLLSSDGPRRPAGTIRSTIRRSSTGRINLAVSHGQSESQQQQSSVATEDQRAFSKRPFKALVSMQIVRRGSNQASACVWKMADRLALAWWCRCSFGINSTNGED